MGGVTPEDRLDAYFRACSYGSADDIAAHFTDDAVVYDTNIAPVRGKAAIGPMWVKVRERWGGATWALDSIVATADGTAAAIEWHMTGTDPRSGRAFVFRGSDHYRLRGGLIEEIRQYWTFDPDRLDTGLVGFDHPDVAPGAGLR